MSSRGHIVLAAALALASAGAASAANTIICWKAIASQPCIKTVVGDTAVGLPTSGVPEGAVAWPKDTDELLCWNGAAWQACATGTGGGAPTDVDYLVKTADGDLSAERAVTDTTTITWDWGTSGQAKATAVDVTCTNCLGGTEIDESTLAAVPTASALAANPTACTGGDFVTDIAADGTLTCSTPAAGGLTQPQVLARLAVGGGY